ncbi:MAG: UDP-N-acetylglucosamine--N-acetylmuramyl-(pentapeptide) pyrophosphoryl-undecaprenol N-acetylglucosamine transferase [Candidatus Saccharimonadales bacterium]
MAAKTTNVIVLTGGGSGGHITPLVAVARKLKQLKPDAKLIYVGQRGDCLSDIVSAEPAIDQVFSVRAGKFRRYNGEGWRQVLALPTQLKNLRDAGWVVIGLWQSFWLMRRIKPSVIFSRGGFVSVPVCLAGKLNGVSFITHDSDSLPSLANRLIARWATWHAVALPEDVYPYDRQKTVTVGIPISADYRPVRDELCRRYRQEIGLSSYKYVLCITGGGNGADDLNKAVAANLPSLLKAYPDLAAMHISGRAHELSLNKLYDRALPAVDRSRVVVKGFVSDFYRYSGAADVVVARAGATNIAEFARQGKACILLPNAKLTGGHQLKNAQILARAGAIKMVDESKLRAGDLAAVIASLLNSPKTRRQLGQAFQSFAKPRAAQDLAELILKTLEHKT